MNKSHTQVLVWFWIIGVIALLWNLMGLFAFYSDMTISEDALAAMDAAKRGLYETQPLWAKIAFGGAVILGTLGSIALLMRKGWASILFGLSLVCVMLQMTHSFMSNAYEIMGGGAMTMGMVVLAGAAFLALYSRWCNTKGYLN